MESLKPLKAVKQNQDAAYLLKHISDSSPGAIYQFKIDKDKNYSFIYASAGFEKLTGISKELILQDYTLLFQRFNQDDLPGLLESIRIVSETASQWDYKFRLENPDTGKTIWIKGTSNPELQSDGSILWDGILMDVSDIEELQEKYFDSNKRYEYATKATNDVIWDWDLISDKLFWSEGFEVVLGCKLTEDKLNLHFWEKCIHPEDIERVSESIQSAILNDSETRWEENYRLVKPDGSIAYINDRGYVIHNKYGRAIRMVGAMKDITDIQLVALERQKLMDNLTRRNETLEQFTYIVSHNLRAPVANLLGLSEAITDATLDTDTKNLMTYQLGDSATKLDSVLKDLNIILNTNKEVNFKKDNIDFQEEFGKVYSKMKEQIENENIEFITDFKKAPNIKIVPNYLHIILLNLISNGIKFKRGENPLIKLTTWKDNKYIYFEYKDNGIGVDLEKHGSKFYNLYHTFHPHIKGKGTGVFLIKTIMNNINGEIAVSSKVNEGTKFFFKFNNVL